MREFRRARLLLFGFCALAACVLGLCLRFSAQLPDLIGRELSAGEMAGIIARNSPLTQYVRLSPNADFPREGSVQKITVHHMGESLSLEEVGQVFSETDRRSSANYAIDVNGKIALYVEEANCPWSSSSRENDSLAVTIEVANDQIGGDWHVSDESFAALIDLCADICLRNGIPELAFTGGPDGSLTLHNMFADTDCPGPYLESRIPDLVREVNRRLLPS